MTGAEKARCQIYQAEAVPAAVIRIVGLVRIMEEIAKNASRRVTAKFVTLETGSARDHCLQFPSQSVLLEKGDDQGQMTGQEATIFETESLHLLRAVKHALKDLRTVRDHHAVISKSVQLLSGLPRQPNKTISGDPK